MTRFIIFLLLNFGALGLGSLLIGNIGNNQWYNDLNKAPWTPPGWVFGAAWFSIMLAFSFYMYRISGAVPATELRGLYVLYAIQWILNVAWNPVFFRFHMVWPGLIVIVALTALVGYFLIWGRTVAGVHALWVLPYFLWLLIATSLNGYIALRN